MTSISRAVSMPEQIWIKIDEYRTEHKYSSNSNIIQQAVKEFLDEDVTEKSYRLIDIAFFSLFIVIILLLMVVIL